MMLKMDENLINNIVCSNCGTTNASNIKFCIKCGTNLQPQSANQNINTDNNVGIQPMNYEQNNSYMNQNNYQEPMPQINTFERGNSNNQELNHKQPKKTNLGLIIGIVVVIFLIILGVLLTTKLLNHKDTNNQNQTSSKDELKSTSLNWDNWELVVDNKNITLPMKYDDFINLGFDVEYSGLAENINYHKIKPNYSFGTNNTMYTTTYTNGKIGGVSLVVYNPSEDTILVKDSVIIGIEFTKEYDYTKGDIKLINKTKGTEVVFGKSSAQDIEKAFGQHYKYDEKNSFHYYPNSNKDSSSTSMDSFIALKCYGESNILTTYGFYYADKGNSDSIKITKSDEKYTVPSNYKLTHETVAGVNKTYRSDEYIVETLEYWKFNNDLKKITQYLENKDQNVSMGKLVTNKKYGEIFVLESDTYHYENRYSYYVLIDDGKYFLQVASLAKSNQDARIGYEKAIDVALQFIK